MSSRHGWTNRGPVTIRWGDGLAGLDALRALDRNHVMDVGDESSPFLVETLRDS